MTEIKTKLAKIEADLDRLRKAPGQYAQKRHRGLPEGLCCSCGKAGTLHAVLPDQAYEGSEYPAAYVHAAA